MTNYDFELLMDEPTLVTVYDEFGQRVDYLYDNYKDEWLNYEWYE